MEMICPKAKDLIAGRCSMLMMRCVETKHIVPHEHTKDCDVTDGGCPACIEYKPEPQNEPQLYILPPEEELNKLLENIIFRDLQPQGLGQSLTCTQLKESISDAVYASAKPVDIEKLAEYINNALFTSFINNKAFIRQAIEEFIKGE